MSEQLQWLTRKQAAFYLSQRGYPITAERLGKLASNKNAGGGPSFTKSRRFVRYLKEDLDDWARNHTVRIS